MSTPTTELFVEINAAREDDREEIPERALRLREELLNLDLETVDLVGAGDLPAGAKAGDPATWGTILITLAASGGVLTTLIGAIQSWLTRNQGSSIKLKIGEDSLEVTNLSSNQEAHLIKDWINRHRVT